MAYTKKMKGGGLLNILQTALKAGQGDFLGAATQFMSPALENMQMDSAKVTSDATYNSKPFGMKYGGKFKQYNAPSHDNGGQMVDENGNPTVAHPVAEIQNNENSYDNYVYSDTLKNPYTGNTFNVDMSKIVKKYKNPGTDMIDKTSVKIAAKNLSKVNDTVRSVVEAVESPDIPMAEGGLDIEPLPTLPIKEIVSGLTGYVPQADNPNLPHVQNPFDSMNNDISVPPGTNPWEGMSALPPNSVEAPNYGTRTGTIKSFLKTQFTPQKSFDDTAYNPESFNQPAQSNLFGNSALTINNNSGESLVNDNLTDGIPDKDNKKGFNFNTAALVGKGLGLANSIKNALEPAEVERARIPDYQSADQAFDRASLDYTQAAQNAIGASNALGNINRNTSSGFSQYRNREAARIAGLQDTLANIGMTERNANSQLDVTRGSYRAQKAQDIANRQREVDIANLQNEAVKQQFTDNLFSEINQISNSFNKYETFKQELQNRKDISNMSLNEFVALAKAKGINFNAGNSAQEFLDSIKRGESPINFVK